MVYSIYGIFPRQKLQFGRAGAGLKSAGLGFTLRAWTLHCGLGPGLPGGGGGLGGLAQKPGPLGLLGYVVKARAQASTAGSGLGPLRPYNLGIGTYFKMPQNG
jgi:hypothetical protein